jgi:GrpB-like predicted nucleotidyltransferase (UPF0157 family)
MLPPLGLEPGVVRLVEYDERWPALFAVELQRIAWECGTLPLRLEHIGSTAIAGMCAKPVLDIVAGRPQARSVSDYAAALKRAGFTHRGERGVPGREFFCKGDPRAYHLHLVEADGPLWKDYLSFRDYLRAHAEAAGEFAALKRLLAARFAGDREAYMHAKSARVLEILRLARAEAA